MINHIKILLREGLLNENKLYGKKIVDPLLNKIGDSSEETVNKIAIAGLFRNNFPPIQTIKTKEQLDTEFNNWYDKIIGELIKNTKTFVDNDDLAKKYLDAYVNNIKSLGVNARPFSIKNIEKTFVDVVNNNGWVEGESSGISKHNIYNPDKDDIMYEDDEILILNSINKAKCVMYGDGESWCIGKPELNYYNTYRLNDGATPYYVLQKNVDGDEHKLVIMNYGGDNYAIADRGNSARHGGREQATDWGGIENDIPNLSGLEEHFPYREVTEDERKYASILDNTRDYHGDDLMGYIQNVIKGLVINGSVIRSEDFIRDYAAMGVKIPVPQLKSLDTITMDSLIEAGYFMGEVHGFEVLSDKQKRRVLNILIDNGKLLSLKEYTYAPDDIKLKYIEKVVNDKKTTLPTQHYNATPEDIKLKYIEGRAIRGLLISPQQYDDAPNELKLKYIERRLLSFSDITERQYIDAPNELKLKYIENGNKLSLNQVDNSPSEVQVVYFKRMIKDKNVSRELFSRFPSDLKTLLFNKLKDGTGHIPQYIFELLNKDEQIVYVKKLFIDTYNHYGDDEPPELDHTLRGLTEWEYAVLPNDYKEKYIRKVMRIGWGYSHFYSNDLTDEQYVVTPPDLKTLYITLKMDRVVQNSDYDKRVNNPEELSQRLYNDATEEQKKRFITNVLKKIKRLPDELVNISSDEIKLHYLSILIGKGAVLTDEEYVSLPNDYKAKYQFSGYKKSKTPKQKDDYKRIWSLYNKSLREGLLELNINEE